LSTSESFKTVISPPFPPFFGFPYFPFSKKLGSFPPGQSMGNCSSFSSFLFPYTHPLVLLHLVFSGTFFLLESEGNQGFMVSGPKVLSMLYPGCLPLNTVVHPLPKDPGILSVFGFFFPLHVTFPFCKFSFAHFDSSNPT